MAFKRPQIVRFSETIRRIVQLECGLEYRTANQVTKSLAGAIRSELVEGNSVLIPGVGKIGFKYVSGVKRMGRMLPNRVMLKFIPHSALKAEVLKLEAISVPDLKPRYPATNDLNRLKMSRARQALKNQTPKQEA